MHPEEEETKFIEWFNMLWKPTMHFMRNLHKIWSGWNPAFQLLGMYFGWRHLSNLYMGLAPEVLIYYVLLNAIVFYNSFSWFRDISIFLISSKAPNPDFISSVRQVVNALFAIVDTIDYLAQFNVLFSTRDLDKWDRRSTQLWMYGLIVSHIRYLF